MTTRHEVDGLAKKRALQETKGDGTWHLTASVQRRAVISLLEPPRVAHRQVESKFRYAVDCIATVMMTSRSQTQRRMAMRRYRD